MELGSIAASRGDLLWLFPLFTLPHPASPHLTLQPYPASHRLTLRAHSTSRYLTLPHTALHCGLTPPHATSCCPTPPHTAASPHLTLPHPAPSCPVLPPPAPPCPPCPSLPQGLPLPSPWLLSVLPYRDASDTTGPQCPPSDPSLCFSLHPILTPPHSTYRSASCDR